MLQRFVLVYIVVAVYCSTTLLFFFSRRLLSLLSTTSPLIFKATVGVSALEITVIVFLMGITRLVSYLTSICPTSPGIMGPSGFLGMVQPQVDDTLDIIKGALPVLVNSKTLTPLAPFSIVP